MSQRIGRLAGERSPGRKETLAARVGDSISIVRGRERQVFLVRYEKLARFCSVCGLIGHDVKECGTGVHEDKNKKFGAWLYADTLNKPRFEDQFGRNNGSKPDENMSQPKNTGKAKVDPEVMDTASSPSKFGMSHMHVDPSVRKRLALEVENSAKGEQQVVTPLGMLALTQGNGEDGDVNSPSSSSNSKRARIGSEGVSGDRSAASLEEDRRTQ